MTEHLWTRRCGAILVRAIRDLQRDTANPEAHGAVQTLALYSDALINLMQESIPESRQPEAALLVAIKLGEHFKHHALPTEEAGEPDGLASGMGSRLALRCVHDLVTQLQPRQKIDLARIEREFRQFLSLCVNSPELGKEPKHEPTITEIDRITRSQN